MDDRLERNKSRARAFIEAIGKQDDLTLASLYAKNGTFWQNGKKLATAGSHSLKETAILAAGIYERLPNGLEFEISSMVAEGDKVAVEAESHATLANGGPYNNQYHFLFHFNDDVKIVEFKEYWDTLYAFETLFEGDPRL